MIYFNYQCYSASFLSRVRLAALPKSIGPGPVQLVMKEVHTTQWKFPVEIIFEMQNLIYLRLKMVISWPLIQRVILIEKI